jgi:hypothetical protein
MNADAGNPGVILEIGNGMCGHGQTPEQIINSAGL